MEQHDIDSQVGNQKRNPKKTVCPVSDPLREHVLVQNRTYGFLWSPMALYTSEAPGGRDTGGLGCGFHRG